MDIKTNVGVLKKGDFVEFSHATGIKQGKFIDSLETLNGITLKIYYTDFTGGYTIEVPYYTVLKIIKNDNSVEEINKPKRYNKRGKLECWDVIIDQEMSFLEGNIIKYVWRYKEKNGVEDLKKARVYLDKLIQELKK